MEVCLLCLESKKVVVDSIVINSEQWNNLNINFILDKYLWPMNHIESYSWICTTCWGNLHEFHKFYSRIEEAHRNFGLIANDVKIEKYAPKNEKLTNTLVAMLDKSSGDEYKDNSIELLKDFFNEYTLNDEHHQSELTNTINTKKNEILLADSGPLVAKHTRGRPRKDNCNGTGVTVNEICHDINSPFSSSVSAEKVKKVRIRKNTRKEYLIKEKTANKLCNLTKKQDQKVITVPENIRLTQEIESDSHIYTDQESDYFKNESNNHTPCPPKKNRNEKDKFLAENFKITCFLCNIPFETFFNMCKHFDEHHTERGHVKCCNKKFYRRSILVDHVHYHLNPNYFKCKCGKVLADRRCLELHFETHESNHEKNHCCDICGKGFAKLGVLKKHRMIHLSEEEKRFSCSDCAKNFASKYLLSSHYRSVHLKKYAKICDICGKSIRCKDVFERHMLQHEGKPTPSVNCDVCGLVLTDKKALKRHKDIIHPAGGQHEYTCSVCSKTSPNLRAHKRHVQYKHVMGYDHKCTICDKAFKRAPTLKEHMASHTGTILYTCPWCPKTFNSNANMHNHRKRVHPKEWEEASRKRYSGNLPPKYKPPTIIESSTGTNVP